MPDFACDTELQREHERRLATIEAQNQGQTVMLTALGDKTISLTEHILSLGKQITDLKHEVGNGLTVRVIKAVQAETKKLYRNVSLVFAGVGVVWTAIQITQFITERAG